MMIAHHVCSLHRNLTAHVSDDNKEKEDFLKRYILYARTHCDPLMSKRAEKVLIEQYVRYRSLRRCAKSEKEFENTPTNQNLKHCPPLLITVRQLEALLRISEAIARMTLSHEVTELHVEQAINIYNVSMTQAKSTGIVGE